MASFYVMNVLILLIFILSLKIYDPLFTLGAKISYDENHIPVVDYGIMDGIPIGKQYNPITVSHNASSYYNQYILTNNETAKGYFLNNANWLVNNSVQNENYTFFEYDFPFPTYNLEAPWYSAMAQALAIPPLLNAYKVTLDKEFLKVAENALNVLFIDIENSCKCGVTYKTAEKGWWYEEYANGHSNGPRVLNGMMFTLVGIYNYYNFTQDHKSLYLFNQGIKSLKNNIHLYDKNGTYSSYDKNEGYAPIEYHKVHVCLLDKLYNLTNDNLFKQYSDEWKKSYDDDSNIEKYSKNCI